MNFTKCFLVLFCCNYAFWGNFVPKGTLQFIGLSEFQKNLGSLKSLLFEKTIFAGNKLPIPVIQLGYLTSFITLFIVFALQLFTIFVRDHALLYFILPFYVISCTVSFGVFNLRIANATKKMNQNIKLYKRFAVFKF